MPQDLLQVQIFVSNEAGAVELPFVEGAEDPRFGDAVEADRRRPRDNRIAFLDDSPKRVFFVSAVTRQRDWDEIVLLVVANKIKHEHVVLAGRFSEAAAKLLNEHDCRLGPAQHDDLVD